ncbi:hypothetical protein K488DRAFT_42608 [Vararia minispora EC-137]|uniref:Uncharacterized protein n=1 Tax=Vararia minispora EC-137 TaxID=1314806 RepID=A0ACB8QWN9_9AGAM|nr:hypothetical protein K488DRAFT_42608 [Vararia minispora EC-137]
MSSLSYEFIENTSLPFNKEIIDHCLKFNIPRGTTIVDPTTKSITAWIKCGPNVTVNEARTQSWTAMALREAGISHVQPAPVFRAFTADYYGLTIGYIAMQYFDGIERDTNDVDLVAKAFEVLISLRAPPTATLGHIGGGTISIVNVFFPGWLPNANYYHSV